MMKPHHTTSINIRKLWTNIKALFSWVKLQLRQQLPIFTEHKAFGNVFARFNLGRPIWSLSGLHHLCFHLPPQLFQLPGPSDVIQHHWLCLMHPSLCVCARFSNVFIKSPKLVVNICFHYSSLLLHECMSMCKHCALYVEHTDIYWSWLQGIFQTMGSKPKTGADRRRLRVHFMKTCVSITINSMDTGRTESPWTFGMGKIWRPKYTDTHKCACTVSCARLWKQAVRPALAHHSSLAANSVRPLSSLLYPTLLSENSIRG